ncbi:uncharacterized protein LOC134259849, partial [Saccostrea cucullata]|uniref:uncharacterized protein LOC134259849 n=1 Tax=Saccostrea cuccullata TaxID=36930 RepID=UPI002ED2ED1B
RTVLRVVNIILKLKFVMTVCVATTETKRTHNKLNVRNVQTNSSPWVPKPPVSRIVPLRTVPRVVNIILKLKFVMTVCVATTETKRTHNKLNVRNVQTNSSPWVPKPPVSRIVPLRTVLREVNIILKLKFVMTVCVATTETKRTHNKLNVRNVQTNSSPWVPKPPVSRIVPL